MQSVQLLLIQMRFWLLHINNNDDNPCTLFFITSSLSDLVSGQTTFFVWQMFNTALILVHATHNINFVQFIPHSALFHSRKNRECKMQSFSWVFRRSQEKSFPHKKQCCQIQSQNVINPIFKMPCKPRRQKRDSCEPPVECALTCA